MIRHRWFLGLLSLLILLPLGCSRAPENEIRIGVNAELTGSKPTVGDSCQKAMELLAAQVNAGRRSQGGRQEIPHQAVRRR